MQIQIYSLFSKHTIRMYIKFHLKIIGRVGYTKSDSHAQQAANLVSLNELLELLWHLE